MRLNKVAVNSIKPYIFDGIFIQHKNNSLDKKIITLDEISRVSNTDDYRLFNNRILPAEYVITINTNCINKINESEFKTDVLLHESIIDILYPMIESRYHLGKYVIYELLKKGAFVTLVSASPNVAEMVLVDNYPEMMKYKDQLKVIIPFWFYKDESYVSLDPNMPNYAKRIKIFEMVRNAGIKVIPFFNPHPLFFEEKKQAQFEFYNNHFPFLEFDEVEQASMEYLLTDDQVKMWMEMKKRNIISKNVLAELFDNETDQKIL